jgi:hypothetical protein
VHFLDALVDAFRRSVSRLLHGPRRLLLGFNPLTDQQIGEPQRDRDVACLLSRFNPLTDLLIGEPDPV